MNKNVLKYWQPQGYNRLSSSYIFILRHSLWNGKMELFAMQRLLEVICSIVVISKTFGTSIGTKDLV